MLRPALILPNKPALAQKKAPSKSVITAGRKAKAPIVAHEAATFIPSGSFLTDCVLGGGWATARIANVVGDRSAGKTLCAIEACANFALFTPLQNIRYVETEAAFDEAHGAIMGMPPGIKVVDDVRTVEEMMADIAEFLVIQKQNPRPCLYVVDSLDALSDAAEMLRDEDRGSYGTDKAKKLSKFFRTSARDLEQANCTLLIISQIRDKLNVMFGETKTRSGGKALDFYASQVIWLVEISKIKRTVFGMDRVVGIHVKVRNRKNKVGRPYREADTTLLFEYGFDDETSMIAWLAKTKALESHKAWQESVDKARANQDRETLHTINTQLREMVWERWCAIEDAIAPKMRKYV